MKDDKKKLAQEAKENLEQVFQAYYKDEPAPDSLKKEVFQTIEMITLAANVIELFTGKFLQVESNFWDDLTTESNYSVPEI